MVGKMTDNTKLSGSQIAAVMGHSKYQTPNEILAQCADAIAGKEPPSLAGEQLDWGNTLEPVILDEAAKRLNVRIKGQINYAIKHKTLPLECSLDTEAMGKGQILTSDPTKGIIVCTASGKITLEGRGNLESKLTSFAAEDVLPLSRGPLQLHAQMMCTKARWGGVCVLYRGVCLRIFLFEPHEPTIKAITEAVKDFDRRLHSNPIQWYGVSTPADACLIYPTVHDSEEPVDLDDELNVLLKGYLQTKDDIKKLQEIVDQTSAIVQSKMGNFSKGKTSSYFVSWPVKNYKEQPEKVVPLRPARQIRQKTITVRAL